MSLTRVAFVWENISWMGAVSYYRNLLFAIKSSPGVKIKPIVFTGNNSPTYELEQYAEIVRTPLLDRKTLPWLVEKITAKLGRDIFLYSLLKQHRIKLISHHDSLWDGCDIPGLPWIPDFQHRRLPEFFTQKEIALRNSGFSKLCRNKRGVILSSHDAKKDMLAFCESAGIPSSRAYVLQFVACLIGEARALLSNQQLTEKYGLQQPWLYLPNQFWVHKNHKVVINALRIGKEQGKSLLVVATGESNDYRNPVFFSSIMDMVRENRLEMNFLYLGVVPYEDMLALMKYAVAVINPSRFEGWSTTVEESKSFGKTILLSDIPVHREQNPRRGHYFQVDDAVCLARLMSEAMAAFDVRTETIEQNNNLVGLNARRETFAREYAAIVSEVVCGNDN